jgi:hypothetical protein
MKFILTESQLVYIRENNQKKNLRLYGFDWDDNILQMPTKIYLKSDLGDVVGMSTEDFAEFRHLIGKEPFDYEGETIVGYDENPYRDFTHSETFLEDTAEAIEKNKKSPSFNKFKENLIYANPFSIITARGHSPSVIKKGVKMFIKLVMEPDEIRTMVKNIKDTLKHEETFSDRFLNQLDELSVGQTIDLYLDERGDYYPVSSKEFGEKFGLETSGGASNPEHAKKVALLDFITKYDDLIKSGKYVNTSLGFSDDDPKNIKAMVEFVNNELSRMYPEVKFIIYDTSEGGYSKIHIEANKENDNDDYMLESLIKRRLLKIKSK